MASPTGPLSSYLTDEYVARPAAIRMQIRGRLGKDYVQFVAGRAAWLSLSGWAVDVAPGQAEVLAAGPDVLLGCLEMACMLGPSDALVETVELEPVFDPVPEGFEVRSQK